MSWLAFFRPLFLWAMLFAAVPILIHFFQRRRTIRLDFSSVRFLREAAVKASRRKRLRRLLLLLTRIAIVAVIVLLFARPYSRFDPFGSFRNPQGRTFAWIDPTISMDYRTDAGTLAARARQGLASLDSTLVHSHELMVFEPCAGAFDVYEPGEESECEPVRHGPTNLGEALRAFRRERMRGTQLPSLVLFSDFQEGTAALVDTFLLSDSVFYPVVCVWLAPRHPYNYAIRVGGAPEGPSPYLECTVCATGRELASGEVSVISGALRTGHERVAVPRNDSASLRIETSAAARNAHGAVRLVPADPYPHDNVDHFVARTRDAVRVLIVCDDASCFPIAAALGAIDGSLWYEPRTLGSQEVRFEDLDSADVIVLAGLSRPARALQALFARRSLDAKVVVFSPAMDHGESSLTRDVFRHLGVRAAPEIVRAESPLSAVLPDTISVLWRGFPLARDRSVAVDRYLAPVPGDVLVRLSNRAALAAGTVDSAGHCWIVLATPLGIDPSNNLAETGFYVPLVDRLLSFGLSSVGARPHEWIAGRIERNPYYGRGVGAHVFDVNGKPVAQWSSQPTVGFDGPGVFRVQPRGEAAYWVAVHADPAEARLVYRRPQPGPAAKRFVKVVDREGFEEFLASIRGSSRLNLLWVVLGLLIVLEILLWQRRGRE
ncbi:MAG: hypothetical protein GF418_01005 [Chitinivibrionales bacterium]|nr:hypothetical protein [Chitinivibrionales bacterium]MBD3394180.1 hypothetical protein [Chitinivibrionales bacterium]